MINSMTAFSRSTVHLPEGHLTIEIRSVNRKHLEINTSLPKELLYLDSAIRKRAQEYISRGKIDIFVTFSPSEQASFLSLTPNLALAKELKRCWDLLSTQLSMNLSTEGFERQLVKENGLFQTEILDRFLEKMQNDVDLLLIEVLGHLCQMKKQEGQFLKKDMQNRLQILSHVLQEIKSRSEGKVKEHYVKLKVRVEELLAQTIELDERILKEVALIADKGDISEEMTRIESHIQLFLQKLNKEAKEGVGKTLDFISQELSREWNTLGAKCSDVEMIHLTIQAKSECEKIREQIQNIE